MVGRNLLHQRFYQRARHWPTASVVVPALAAVAIPAALAAAAVIATAATVFAAAAAFPIGRSRIPRIPKMNFSGKFIQ